MKKSASFFLFFVFFVFLAKAQDYTITGKVLDENSQPLTSATVFIETLADSTLINYGVSGTSGDFNLEFRTKQPTVRVVITYTGYETYRKEIKLDKKELTLGDITLNPIAFELEGVSVTGTAAPITVKADTLEFNAGSFKVAPDSNVEALLKQLPGVDVTADGKITVNGKEVNNILVNGKPFFGKDGKIAVQNLPAELIEKIQVTDTKTKEEELSGDSASSEEKTINLTIQEDKNKGIFGKAMAGYGTDDRYESSLLFNTFKGDRKLSVLGSSNNINSIGFSMDEVFDNMGGGRNQSMYVNSDGSFGINGMRFGGNTGITQSNMIGINYADNWGDETVEPSGTYYFTETQTDNTNRTETTNLLPDRTTVTNSNYITDNYSRGHNISTDIEVKIDSTLSVYLNPNFTNSINKNNYSQSQQTTNEDRTSVLNESTNNSFESRDKNTFGNELFMYKKFQKKGRGLNFGFENNNSKEDVDLNTQSETYFYETGNPADIRNQNRLDTNEQNSYGLSAGYREPLTDSLVLGLNLNYNWNNSRNLRNTYDFNDVTDTYDDLNDAQSNFYYSSTNKFTPQASLNVRKSKIRAGVDLGADFTTFKNKSVYLGNVVHLNKDYVLPNLRGHLSLNLTKSKSIWSSYSYSVSLPTAQQILPVENLSNPLNTVVGNEDLNPTKRHNLYFNFNDYDWATRSGFFMYGGATLYNDQIVASTVFDEDNKAATTYQNLDNVYNGYMGLSMSKSIKKEHSSFRYGAGLNVNYNKSKGLTNAELYESSGWQLNPEASFAYEITDMFTIEPSYEFTYYNTQYDNYVIDKSTNFTHKAKIQTTLYFLKNAVWGNDFGYNYNSNIADGFQKDFYLWNTSLGYNFFNKKLLAKVKVYDLLDQNVSATRNITPTAIINEQNTVLKQYVMFSLTLKLEKFGGAKKESNSFFID